MYRAAGYYRAPYYGAPFFGASDGGDLIVAVDDVYGAYIEVETSPEGAEIGWRLSERGKVIVPAGNGVRYTCRWQDVDEEDAIPISVHYQVFDPETGNAVSPLVNVAPLAATMPIVVRGAHLPASSEDLRRLEVQIRGTFSDGQHTAVQRVYVRRLYPMS